MLPSYFGYEFHSNYHLVADHECSLQTESSSAELIQIFKTRPQEVHDHNVDPLLAGTFLSRPQTLWEAFKMMAIGCQGFEELGLMSELRVLDVGFFLNYISDI